MMRVAVRRLLTGVVLLFVVSGVSFILLALTPGDAARAIVGIDASHSEYERVRQQLGLDLPLPDQYWRWLWQAVHGNFGASVVTQQPVREAIDQRLSVTASLIVGSLLVILVLGVAFGVFSAVRGGVAGKLVDAFALGAFAVPAFWLGEVLITVFAVKLHWLPAIGYVPFAQSPMGWLESLVLPVLALAAGGVAAIARQTREAMLEALGSEYVRMARATGISRGSILFRHAFRNAALRVVTVLGWIFVGLLGGTVFVESVFGLPGMGGLAVTAATDHDVPLIQGVVVYFTLLVVVVNALIDLLYRWLDPRLRVG